MIQRRFKMSKNRGEIVIGTVILICLLVYPINWAIDRVVQMIVPPKVEVKVEVVEILPVGEIDGQVIYVIKEVESVSTLEHENREKK